jgi:hypothetical protein
MAEFLERNRQFLTQVLCGAGAFLVLSYFVLSFGAESERERRTRLRLLERKKTLQRTFSDRSGLPEGSVRELEKALAARAADVCVSVPADLAAQRSLATHFLKQKESACADLSQRADQEAVDIKVALSGVDFHQRDTDGPEKYEEHWAALACFRRVMAAVIASGFDAVLSITVEGVRTEPVPGQPEWSVAHHGVTVELVGRFEDFVRLHAAVNEPGKFVVLETTSLKRRVASTDNELMGTVTAWAVRLIETKTPRRGESGAGGTPRYKR